MLVLVLSFYLYKTPYTPSGPGPPLLRLRVRSGLLCSGLLDLGPPLDLRLDADAAEHKAHAEPLHLREVVAEGDDGQDHGEHLARDCDGDEDDGAEVGDGVD